MSTEQLLEHQTKVKHFLNAVCQSVRAQKLHSDIKEELLSHIEVHVQESMEQGMTKEKAIESAIASMGDPKEIGKGFDKVHRPRTDWALLIPFVLLVGSGLLVMLSLQSGTSFGQSIAIFDRQAVFSVMGLTVMVVMWAFDYERLKKFSEHLFGIGIALLCIVNFPFFSSQVNGLRGWVHIMGNVSLFVPSIAIFLLSIGLAGASSAKDWKWQKTIYELLYRGALPLLLLLGLKAYIWAAIYAAVLIVHVWMTRKNALQAMGISIGAICALVGVAASSYTLKERATAFLYHNDPLGKGYSLARAMDAMHSGGWLGQGFGSSSTMNFRPSDSVIAYFINSFGWAAGLSLILLIIAFMYKLLLSVLFIRDEYGKRITAGLSTILAIHFIWPILKVLGYAPFSNIDIPFLSYGGNGQIIQFAMIGLLLGIYRRRDMLPSP